MRFPTQSACFPVIKVFERCAFIADESGILGESPRSSDWNHAYDLPVTFLDVLLLTYGRLV